MTNNMTGKKELKLAKLLAKKSTTGTTVDAHKVKIVLKELSNQKLSHPTQILKTYKRLISDALRKEEVVVESANKITNLKDFERNLKKKTQAKRIKYITNPQIVAGARIIHGDWIYDATLDAKLEQLTSVSR